METMVRRLLDGLFHGKVRWGTLPRCSRFGLSTVRGRQEGKPFRQHPGQGV